jgi:phosphoglycerate kinase
MEESLLKLLKVFSVPKLKTIKDINFKNKRVLMRVDFNVPLEKKEKIAKIKATIPTLKYLIKQKSKIILISHLNRPKGKIIEELRLDSVAKKLEKLLRKDVRKLDSIIDKKVEQVVEKMKPGEIVMLENIRFYPEEEKNSPKFAKELSKLGDIFINEAFAVSHRKHTSIIGITKYLSSIAGPLFQQEIKELNKVLHKPEHPLVVIIGGAKVATKIKVIEKFLKRADKLIIAGALPNTIFAARDINVGQSFVEKDMFKIVEELDLESPKIQLPVDFVCQNSEIVVRGINAVKENESIFDMGPRTVKLFLESIRDAKMIVWNGPLGVIEKKPFDRASEILAKAIAQSKAYSIIGGGDTAAFARKLGLEKKFNYVSTGGGAMLEYLANETLPGIDALNKK